MNYDIRIKRDNYEELLRDKRGLFAIYAADVDNWEDYFLNEEEDDEDE